MEKIMNQTIPRSEYPRPQFVRPDWLCLNGEWQFEIDAGDSGLERGLLDRELLERILVPFCPESELSGISNTDFMNAVWYRRTVQIPEEWQGSVLLHFQAVDYDATIWARADTNRPWVEIARHRGGFTPITCCLAGIAGSGEEVTIVVRARDPHRFSQPRGKQCPEYANIGCLYTRTSGIWQSVWMEPVGEMYLKRPRLTPDIERGTITVEAPVFNAKPGATVQVVIADGSGWSSSQSAALGRNLTPRLEMQIPVDRCRYWQLDDPFLYDLEINLLDVDGLVIDRVKSYAGLRSIAVDGLKVLLNGKPLFQRLVLDQGFYPDGILTAPSDQALIEDIELSQAAGFNGARLHQKVFEERFLYHADRLGYLVWGEFPDWGCSGFGTMPEHQQPGATYITQWLEALERDYSHPSIVGWCPLNETWQVITDRLTVLDDVTRGMFLATKAMDGTRPVLDASGYSHRVPEADIYDCHTYEQDVARFAQEVDPIRQGKPFTNRNNEGEFSLAYRGQPYFVSEFGGIWWNPDIKPGEFSWGYGNRPSSIEEFYQRFEGLCNTLLNNEFMFGYCYTQLTDVFQEQNGIYRFDRRPKFDLERLKSIQQRTAAIEC
jgi:beta-galactosidase/beta-glucuronidase